MQQDLESRIQSVVEYALTGRMDEMRRELTERLKDECETVVQAQLDERGSESAREARRQTAESLADGVRRIRVEDTVAGIAGALVDTAAEFAGRCALFIHKGDQLLGFRMSGGGEERSSFEKR